MKKKPDRFERMVWDHKDLLDYGPHGNLLLAKVITLLREEHNWMVQMVEKEPELPGPMPDEMWAAMCQSKDVAEEAMRVAVRRTKQNILDQLTRRAK